MAKLLVIGNPLLDISAEVSAEYMAKYDLSFVRFEISLMLMIGMSWRMAMLSWLSLNICQCMYSFFLSILFIFHK